MRGTGSSGAVVQSRRGRGRPEKEDNRRRRGRLEEAENNKKEMEDWWLLEEQDARVRIFNCIKYKYMLCI